MPDGLGTVIKGNGKNLSGGQRQRIALARGLIRNVQYIVLDEGTSALDEANTLDSETNLLNTHQLGVIIITHNLRDSIREHTGMRHRFPRHQHGRLGGGKADKDGMPEGTI